MSTARNSTKTPGARPAGELVTEALAARPGATASELVEGTGLGKSTVAKALAALQAAGLASRDVPAESGGPRVAARWNPTTPASLTPAPTTTASGTARATHARQPKAAKRGATRPAGQANAAGGGSSADRAAEGEGGEGGQRLRPGQLGTLVLEYLVSHAGEPVGPTLLGKHLHRSQGAIANALARLADSGDAVLVSDKPRRYRIAG